MFSTFLAAVRFLTICPLPPGGEDEEQALAASPPFFPLAGLGIGLAAATATLVLWPLLPSLPAATLIVLLLATASGGLHLDGLADTADGFFSSRQREQMLAIMRDSRIGTMGVLALIFILAIKITALGSLERGAAARAALLMPVAGRCALLLLMAQGRYVRDQGGLGTLFYRNRGRVKLGIGAIVGYCIMAVFLDGTGGLIATVGLVVVLLLFAALCHRLIGGMTGDTLGAGCELAEAITALLLAAL